MQSIFILALTISSYCFAQTLNKLPNQSPNKRYSVTTSTKQMADNNIEWQYWLVKPMADSMLLTTSILHDMPAPVVYWNKASTKLIYEEQTYRTQQIRIYDLNLNKLIFQKDGFIWEHSTEYFDQERGILIFFRESKSAEGNFNVFKLNVETLEVKPICTVNTSADPYTGAPEILTMNRAKRTITLLYETSNGVDTTMKNMKVGY